MGRMGRTTTARLVTAAALASALGDAGQARSEPTSAGFSALIVTAKDHAELNEKFCAADPNVEHVIVLPASLFVDSEQLACGAATYKLYRIIERDDTDDFEYFLDPPSYAEGPRLGCDGKAGRTMQTVAINCRPLK